MVADLPRRDRRRQPRRAARGPPRAGRRAGRGPRRRRGRARGGRDRAVRGRRARWSSADRRRPGSAAEAVCDAVGLPLAGELRPEPGPGRRPRPRGRAAACGPRARSRRCPAAPRRRPCGRCRDHATASAPAPRAAGCRPPAGAGRRRRSPTSSSTAPTACGPTAATGPCGCRLDLGGEAAVRALAVRLAAAAGRRLDESRPWVDARLARRRPAARRRAAGRRRAAPTSACGSCGPAGSVSAALEAAGSGAPGVAAAARGAWSRRAPRSSSRVGPVRARRRCWPRCSSLVPARERLVLVEDVGELRPRHPHVVRLEARHANVEGRGEVTLAELTRQALRMRPDRLVVGECRGAEVRDLLAALNTGHAGGCATVHANAAAEVPARLEALGSPPGWRRPRWPRRRRPPSTPSCTCGGRAEPAARRDRGAAPRPRRPAHRRARLDVVGSGRPSPRRPGGWTSWSPGWGWDGGSGVIALSGLPDVSMLPALPALPVPGPARSPGPARAAGRAGGTRPPSRRAGAPPSPVGRPHSVGADRSGRIRPDRRRRRGRARRPRGRRRAGRPAARTDVGARGDGCS